MVLKMPRPFRDNQGRYWLRVRVPKDVQIAFGSKTHKQSLGTTKSSEAERRFVQALANFRSRCENLRRGPAELTEQEAQRVATPVYFRWLDNHRDNPSSQTEWIPSDFAEVGESFTFASTTSDFVCAPSEPPRARIGVPEIWDFAARPARRMERIAREETSRLIEKNGLVLNEISRQRLSRAVQIGIQKACVALQQFCRGEIHELPGFAQNQPAAAKSAAVSGKPVNLSDVFEGWRAERKPTQKTAEEWKGILRQLEQFVGSSDAGQLERNDIVRWKDELVKSKSAKTINDSYLTAAKTVLRWGVENGRLPSNPADNVRVHLKPEPGIRGFTADEATVILNAAMSALKPERKWIPILLCYSGARVGEVSQLRCEDIRQHADFVTMSFDPKAGRLKTPGSERTVPLHPAILQAGFIDYVSEVGSGPLFKSLPPDKFGRRGGTATKRLGPWIRSLGITDKRISPNHSWRHWFKTQGRDYEIPDNISDAITGHVTKTVGNRYGTFSLEALYREIKKLPAISL